MQNAQCETAGCNARAAAIVNCRRLCVGHARRARTQPRETDQRCEVCRCRIVIMPGPGQHSAQRKTCAKPECKTELSRRRVRERRAANKAKGLDADPGRKRIALERKRAAAPLLAKRIAARGRFSPWGPEELAKMEQNREAMLRKVEF